MLIVFVVGAPDGLIGLYKRIFTRTPKPAKTGGNTP
jgi:hypothetical protein